MDCGNSLSVKCHSHSYQNQ